MTQGKQVVCAFCNRIETERFPTEIDVVTGLPIHNVCYGKWVKLSGIHKKVRIRIYKLAEDESFSPSYYHGLDVAEDVFLEIVEDAKTKFPLQKFEHIEPRKWNFVQYKHHYDRLAHEMLQVIEWFVEQFGSTK